MTPERINPYGGPEVPRVNPLGQAWDDLLGRWVESENAIVERDANDEDGPVATTGDGWLDREEARRLGYVPVEEYELWVPESEAQANGWTVIEWDRDG